MTHSSRDKVVGVFHTTYPNAFSWKNIIIFWFEFHLLIPKGLINNVEAEVQLIAWREAIIWTNDDPII